MFRCVPTPKHLKGLLLAERYGAAATIIYNIKSLNIDYISTALCALIPPLGLRQVAQGGKA